MSLHRIVLARRLRRDEEGVFLVLWALMVVAVLMMVAIVIDLSALRQDRRQQRLAADGGVTAGGLTLNGTAAGRLAACQDAWAYAAHNLGYGAAPPPSPCAPITGSCDPAVAQSVTSSIGAYQVTITTPVLDGDVLMMKADAIGGDVTQSVTSGDTLGSDGDPCSRIGVRISSTRSPLFARVAGFGSHTTDNHSVARIAPGGPADEPATLVLLERHDCRAVRTDGTNSRLIVTAANGSAGRIHSDSRGDGSCPGGAKVVEGFAGSSGPSIFAEHLRNAAGVIVKPARIQIYAKLFGSANAHTPWPTTVGEPDPVGFNQVGRAPIDQRYLQNVKELEAAATLAVNSITAPAGYVNVTDAAPTGLGLGCSIDTPTPPAELSAPNGRFWFNCPGGLTVRDLAIASTNAEVVINGPLTVNMAGFRINDARRVWVKGKSTGNLHGIDVSAPFIVNNGPTAAVANPTCTQRFASNRSAVGTIFVKEGDVAGNGATIRWCQMFAYLRGAPSPTAPSALPSAPTPPPALPPPPGDYGSIGTINVLGTSSVDWTAPNEMDVLPTTADLAVRKYEDFALWTEAHGSSRLNGGGGMNLGGIYFLPNADPFTIAGSSGQNIGVDAQFYVRKLVVAGGSILRMTPNPSNQVPIPTNTVALIR